MNDFENMTWLNSPPHSRIEEGKLSVRTGRETDFWRGTFYGFWRDSGHFLHQTVVGDFSAEVTITAKFEDCTTKPVL